MKYDLVRWKYVSILIYFYKSLLSTQDIMAVISYHLGLSVSDLKIKLLLEKELIANKSLVVDLLRAALGTPIAYIIGYEYFRGHKFKVDKNTLIPRSDTELIVDISLRLIKINDYTKILDLCTGSGVIGISIARELKNYSLSMSDISELALDVSEYNLKMFRVNANLILSDCYENIYDKYHLIVSNPPYISQDDPHLKDLSFEPQIALVSRDNGYYLLKKIIINSKQRLLKSGCLVLEHGYNQAVLIREFMMAGGYKSIKTFRDRGGQDRVTLGFCNL